MATQRITLERLRLFDAVLSECADAAQFDQLEQLLDQDRQAREQFADYSQLDVELRHAFRTGMLAPGGAVVDGSHFNLQAEKKAASNEASQLPSGKRSSTNWTDNLWSWISWVGLDRIGLAGALAAAVIALMLHTPTKRESETKTAVVTTRANRPPGPVATLASHANATWKGKHLKIGHTIREGSQISLLSGSAQFSIGAGAEIAATAPCSLTFTSRDRVLLHSGDVTVQVAEWAKGFTIETDEMEVVDLGTTFSVSALNGSAKASVLKGQVRVNPHAAPVEGPRSVLVSEGEALVVDGYGRKLERQLLESQGEDLTHFEDWQPYRPLALHNTGVGFAVGDEDPYWRVTSGPQESFDKPQFAVVCKPDERYLPNESQQSQWVSMANWRESKANAIFTFQTNFDLSGFDLRTIQLFGRFLADNGIQAVRVNGVPVEVQSWTDNVFGQEFDHAQFRTVDVTDGLVQGTNEIEIDVWNGTFQHLAADTPNPMALRVEWHAFGRQELHAADGMLNDKVGRSPLELNPMTLTVDAMPSFSWLQPFGLKPSEYSQDLLY